MKTILLISTLFLSLTANVCALAINEVMSNPIGDDGGREWIELYNETGQVLDISSLGVSIKGGAFVAASPVSGGTSIPPYGYGIIGSTVSGATKFLVDYPSYEGVLFRSSISLVNTGVTSIDIKVGGVTALSIPSYTGAKEGYTYSLVGRVYEISSPTPGKENQSSGVVDTVSTGSTTTTNANQATYLQGSVPTSDIVLYLPNEKTVVAGASSIFSVFSLTHGGKAIENISYAWSFGDGGSGAGSSTKYHYYYPGVYTAHVEGTNGHVFGLGSVKVRVVAPEVSVSSLRHGKYGMYITLTNPNDYDLDISQWKVAIDGAGFPFPKNTTLRRGSTIIPAQTLGFASTTYSSSTLIKLLFPNMEEVARAYQDESFRLASYTSLETSLRTEEYLISSNARKSELQDNTKIDASNQYVKNNITTTTKKLIPKDTPLKILPSSTPPAQKVTQKTTTKPTIKTTSTSTQKTTTQQQKDTRIASWVKSLFGRQ